MILKISSQRFVRCARFKARDYDGMAGHDGFPVLVLCARAYMGQIGKPVIMRHASWSDLSLIPSKPLPFMFLYRSGTRFSRLPTNAFCVSGFSPARFANADHD